MRFAARLKWRVDCWTGRIQRRCGCYVRFMEAMRFVAARLGLSPAVPRRVKCHVIPPRGTPDAGSWLRRKSPHACPGRVGSEDVPRSRRLRSRKSPRPSRSWRTSLSPRTSWPLRADRLRLLLRQSQWSPPLPERATRCRERTSEGMGLTRFPFCALSMSMCACCRCPPTKVKYEWWDVCVL